MSNLKPGQIVRLGNQSDLAHHCKVALNGGNVFGYDTLKGGDTGVTYLFGPGAAAATIAMKRRLGYPEKAIGPGYGATLDAYLHGTRNLPAAYQAHRASRAAAAALSSRRRRVLNLAAGQVGYVEGANNANKYSTADGRGPEAWCADFVSYILIQAGIPWFNQSYVPNIVALARNPSEPRLRVASAPAPGRLACFDWDDDGTADHIGICTSTARSGLFDTIEGNTSPADFSNGGMVMRRHRSLSDVQAFVDVKGVTF